MAPEAEKTDLRLLIEAQQRETALKAELEAARAELERQIGHGAQTLAEAGRLRTQVRDLLIATGLEADVDAGRDPLEAARSFRQDANRWADDSAALADWRETLDALDAIPEQELRSSGNWYGWAQPIGEALRARKARKAVR